MLQQVLNPEFSSAVFEPDACFVGCEGLGGEIPTIPHAESSPLALECPLGLDSGLGFVVDNPDLADLGLDLNLEKGFLSEELDEGLDSMKGFDGSSFGSFHGVHSLPVRMDSHVHSPSDGQVSSSSKPVHKRKKICLQSGTPATGGWRGY